MKLKKTTPLYFFLAVALTGASAFADIAIVGPRGGGFANQRVCRAQTNLLICAASAQVVCRVRGKKPASISAHDCKNLPAQGRRPAGWYSSCQFNCVALNNGNGQNGNANARAGQAEPGNGNQVPANRPAPSNEN